MANLFSVSNGKMTYNNVSSEKLEKTNKKKNNLKQLKNNYKDTQKQVKTATNNIGTYLNKNGQNVNVNAPFQANVISNSQINKNKNSLNGRVTLEDVVQEHNNLLNNTETGQELKTSYRQSKNENAWAGYNYNKAKVDSEKTTFADKTIGNITRGIADLTSNMGDSRDVVDKNGKTIKLPSYSELKQQKVSDDYNTWIGGFLGDTTYNIAKIGSSTLLNVPTLGIGGSAVYWSDMYFDNYNSAKNEGYEEKNATTYAMINTLLEFLTGKLLGTATSRLTGGASNELSNAIANGVNKLISNPKVANIIGNAGSEAAEEFIQEYLDNINKLVTLEGSKDPKEYVDVLLGTDVLKDAIYSAGVGALSGGFFGGIDSNNEVKNIQYNVNLLNSYKEQLEETKANLTDKTTIAQYESIINDIDNYVKSPFGNESSIDIATVYDLIDKSQTNNNDSSLSNNISTYANNLTNNQNQYATSEEQNQNSNSNGNNIPTVNDLVRQQNLNSENTNSTSNINLPISRNNTTTSAISNSNVSDLTTTSNLGVSNTNTTPTTNTPNLSPNTVATIKAIKTGSNPNITYTTSSISNVLQEVGIEVPTSFRYVDGIRQDLTYTTTKELTQNERQSITNALSLLRNIDINSVNYSNSISAPMMNYHFVESNNTQVNELRRSASQYLNNSEQSRQVVSLLEKIIADKDYTIRFNPNITTEDGTPVNGLIRKENGKTVIELNPNANNYVEFLLVHEITHDIATKEMKELILDYAKKDNNFNNYLKEIQNQYSTNDVTDEVVANVCGQLFGTQEFIQSVVEKKPSIFKKILNNIRKLADKIKGTGANEYISFVEKLKGMWEDAYYSNQSNLKGQMFSIKQDNTDISQINQTKGNIPINQELLNKYSNVREIFDNESSNYNGNIKVKDNIKELKNIDINNLTSNETKRLAKEIFKKYNINETFENNGNKIAVTGSGIEESINKIFASRSQRNLLKEHLQVFSDLGDIIEHATLVNQTKELKNRISINSWNYYFDGLEINGKKYNLEFDVRSMKDGTNQYRVQRLEEQAKKLMVQSRASINNIDTYRTFEPSISNNNIPQSNENVKLPIANNSNMQKIDNNAISLEKRVSGNKLLDTQDLIEEIKSVGAKVDKNGYVTLYHQTTIDNANKIKQSGKMTAKEPYVYFSTSENASQSDGRGNTKIEFKIPAEKLLLDDIFSDNADVKIKLDSNNELDISNYIVNNKNDLNEYIFDDEFYKQFENEDKTKITKSIDKLQQELNTIDENTDDGWAKGYHIRQQIRALENGYNSEYDYIIGREKDRLSNDYERGLLNKRIEEKKKRVEKNKQLQQDINESTPLQKAQYEVIQKTNPAPENSNYVWIRSPKDIKTFAEVINDKDSFTWGDYSKEDALRDLEKGTVTIYSSYPIKNGVFVSTSYQQALDYAGGDQSQVHSKKVLLNSVAWINGDEGQYANTLVKNTKYSQDTNTNYLEDTFPTAGTKTKMSDIKGNIPINQELLNKYSNAEDIFSNEKNNYDMAINIKPINIDIQGKNATDIYHIATEVFKENHNKSVFVNDNNQIKVTNQDIKESINKIFNDRLQNMYLKEHLSIFSDLGNIIENSRLVNQTYESKNRSKYVTWNYYFSGININNELFDLEFDVVSRADGENHYRLQRIKRADTQSTLPINGEVDFGVSALSGNNISQSSENVKLPTVNNSKTQNPNEISKLTKKDANTTPKLPKAKVTIGAGESNFYENVTKTTKMLPENVRDLLATENDIQYYKEITNKESLNKALEKLNNDGASETFRWFKQNSEQATATDVAEGWILLKQYSDAKDYDSVVEVAKKMREIGTRAGQTVQAFNIMQRLTPEGMVKYAQSELSEAYDNMVKNKTKDWIDKYRKDFELKPDDVQFIMDTMKEVSKMEDGYDKRVKLAEIQKLMTDKLPPEKGAGIKSWMRISMLFNPKTQVRNVAGNALIAPVNYFGDMFSSYADKIISKKTGVRTTGNMNIKAILKGMKQGAYEATNDYKKGINTKDMDGNRFEIGTGKSFNEKHDGLLAKQRNAISKGLNRTEALLNYVMDAGDRVFSEASFENSLQNQMILNNTTEITQEMIDIAHQEALSRTWNDNNNYTKFVLGIRKGFNNININGYGLGDVLIPFAKTPANLTKAIVDYSPAGLVNTITSGIKLKRSLSNGQYTAQMQHQFVQNLGKATAGTMLYVLGIALAKAGITSGESDDDKDVANFLKNTLGISSYSIKIGNKSFTYDWAQPLAAPLSITANLVQKNKENATLYENIISSLNTAGNILLEQSFLDSLNTVLSNNEGIATGIQEAILELPSRAVPTFVKQIADLTDGTQRQTFVKNQPLETAKNKILAKIPIANKSLPSSVDTMGRDIKKYGGKNNIFNVFLNPATVNTKNISDSAKEIYRLYKSIGETDIMPRVAPYYINQDGEKIILTPEQRTKYQKVSGDIIEKNVKKLKNSKEYKNMSDKDKAEVIKNIVNYSYNIAKNEVLDLELSKTYQKAYDYSEIGDISDYYTFKASIDDTNKDTKKASITNYLINSNLNNEQLSFLYGNYYSSEATLNTIVKANIPMKEFIKFDTQSFESDYNSKGKAITNSRKNKVINYVNSLNLSIPQKAMLIKMEYNSFKTYDNQIVSYVNSLNDTKFEKAKILKKTGFSNYNDYLINYINSQNLSYEDKKEQLEDLGFKIRNGKVYSK